MKTMREIQEGLIAQARWDGGYPKVIHVGLGIIALARTPEEEAELRSHARWSTVICILAGIIVVAVFVMVLL